MRHFRYFVDPGHGWLRVPLTALYVLGIADRITAYSYRRERYAYLEEDVDGPLFVRTYEARYGRPPTIVETITDRTSRIREYPRYVP